MYICLRHDRHIVEEIVDSLAAAESISSRMPLPSCCYYQALPMPELKFKYFTTRILALALPLPHHTSRKQKIPKIRQGVLSAVAVSVAVGVLVVAVVLNRWARA